MKTRLDYIDVLKGVSILCITFLHYEEGTIPSWLNVWIGMFMITAFYFTSGWITGITRKEISTQELIKKRWKSLGLPYIYFSILIFCFDLVWFACGQYDMKFLLQEIYKTLTLRGIGTLWFLPALFGGEIIFRWLLNSKKLWLWLLCLIITLTYVHYYNTIWLHDYRNISSFYQIIDAFFRTIKNILFAWPVIAIAYYISFNFLEKLTQMNQFAVFGIGALITTLSILINGGFLQINLAFFSPLFNPIIGPLGLLILFMPISKGSISKIFSYWGRNSLVLMVTHYSITMVLCKYICEKVLEMPFSGASSNYFFIVTVLLTYPLVWLFDNKLSFMLGKK